MCRIEWDVSDFQIGIAVPLGLDITTAVLDPHLDIEFCLLGDGRDVYVGIEDLYVRIGLDVR